MKNRKKYFVGCYAPWLRVVIFAVTNIVVEILVYIQIFILVKAAFSLEGFQRSSLIVKKPSKQSKIGILIKRTKKLVVIVSNLWTRYYIKRKCKRSHCHNPPSPYSHAFAFWWTLPILLSGNVIIECYHINCTKFLFLCILLWYKLLLFMHFIVISKKIRNRNSQKRNVYMWNQYYCYFDLPTIRASCHRTIKIKLPSPYANLEAEAKQIKKSYEMF